MIWALAEVAEAGDFDAPGRATRAESIAGILPGRLIIRGDRAVLKTPFAARREIHACLDGHPVGPRGKHDRGAQDDDRAAKAARVRVRLRRAVFDERARQGACVRKKVDVEGIRRARAVEILPGDIDAGHDPSLAGRHDKIVAALGIVYIEPGFEVLGDDCNP